MQNISFLLLLLITHQLHYLSRSPLPFQQLAYAFGMVQPPKSSRHRSGFARTTSSFDAKCRVNRASRQDSYGGSGSRGIIRGTRESGSQHTGDSNVESLDLPGTTFPHCGSPAGFGDEVEIMESLGDEMDLLESESNERLRSDRIAESQCDSNKYIERLHNLPMEAFAKDSAKISSHEESIKRTQEPESKYPERFPLDTIEVEDILQSTSEEPLGRDSVDGNQKSAQSEDPKEYVPLNLKIPVHAREKLKRRSLEDIQPILERKAKLPLGPRDAPDKK